MCVSASSFLPCFLFLVGMWVGVGEAAGKGGDEGGRGADWYGS